tara:strand:- start:18733 stop:19401 length:669 start_codon:yes stop_codon:yes gene_type:complete
VLTLREFYKRKDILHEAELDISSLDTQIDRYLTDYEQQSQKSAKENLPQVTETLSLKEFFTSTLHEDETEDLISKLKDKEEQESEPATEEPVEKPTEPLDTPELKEPKPEPEAEEPEISDTETEPVAKPEDLSGETDLDTLDDEESIGPEQRPGALNLSNFANSVNNLIKNYTNLLDMKSVILNRALELVRNNYGEEDANEFEQLLANNYKLQSAEKYDKPY